MDLIILKELKSIRLQIKEKIKWKKIKMKKIKKSTTCITLISKSISK